MIFSSFAGVRRVRTSIHSSCTHTHSILSLARYNFYLCCFVARISSSVPCGNYQLANPANVYITWHWHDLRLHPKSVVRKSSTHFPQCMFQSGPQKNCYNRRTRMVGMPLSMAKRSLYAKSFFSTFIRHLVLASSKCCVVWYNNSCQSSPRARLSFSMFHARTRMICSSIADRSNSERESNRLMCMSHGSINSARRTTTATNRPPHHQNTER